MRQRFQAAILGLLAAVSLPADPAIVAGVSIDSMSAHLRYPQITADRQGNFIIAGLAADCSLTVVNPLSVCGPLWIAKLDPSGTTIVFATYIGSASASNLAPPNGTPSVPVVTVPSVAADRDGNIVLLSSSAQNILPVANAVQNTVAGARNLYVLKLAADGSRIIYATYLGGSGTDTPAALALDDSGAVYLGASTNSPDFPTTPQSLAGTGTYRSVIVKLPPGGRPLQYAAFLEPMYLQPLQVDPSGAVWFIDSRQILKLAPDGSALDRSPLPSWAAGSLNTTVLPTDDGGYWLWGATTGHLPVTPDAAQPSIDPVPYIRIEDRQTTTPAIPTSRVRQFAVDPVERWRIYAATDNGLLRSEDNGWTWTALTTKPSLYISVDPFDQNTLYLDGSRSSDRGQTWTPLGPGFGGASVSPDSNIRGLLYAPSSASDDGGLSWRPLSIPWDNPPCLSPSACIVHSYGGTRGDPAHPGRAYAAILTRCNIGPCGTALGFWRSEDGGATFVPTHAGDFLQSDLTFDLDSSNGDLFFLGRNGGGLAAYRNANLDTQEVLPLSNVSGFTLDAAYPGTVYASEDDLSIQRSDDGGRTFRSVGQTPAPAYALAIGDNGVVHANGPAFSSGAFVFRFDSAGNIIYGTFFGGYSLDPRRAVLGPAGHLFLGGTTKAGLPTLNAVQPGFGGSDDGFLAEFDASGALLRSTYLGGITGGSVDSIFPQDDGSVVVAGNTYSPDFRASLQPSLIGAGTLFVLHIAP
jgi:hypothetical protein